MTDDNTIFITTADKIADTGTISFKFMVDAKPPDEMRNAMIKLPWGWVWAADYGYGFNVFKSGGLVVGGGWTPEHDTEEWAKEMIDGIPACSLLMTTAVFEWLKVNILEKFDRPYQRHHSEDILATS